MMPLKSAAICTFFNKIVAEKNMEQSILMRDKYWFKKYYTLFFFFFAEKKKKNAGGNGIAH